VRRSREGAAVGGLLAESAYDMQGKGLAREGGMTAVSMQEGWWRGGQRCEGVVLSAGGYSCCIDTQHAGGGRIRFRWTMDLEGGTK
jgi:hypothetical protein